jgi:phage/plasmid-like protein (TIGR03299 family)
MGANISEKDGKSTVFVVGEPAWHKLGKVLERPAMAKEAIIEAGLDYEIEMQEIFLKNSNKFKGKFATVRKDTQIPFSVQSSSYVPVQNIDAFNFFDEIIGEGKAIYHSAGALGKGERIWIMAKLPDDIIIKNIDNVEKYLLLSNSHDGSSSLKMYFTPVRVVCQNTLNASINQKSDEQISLKHTRNIQMKINDSRKALGLALSYYEDFANVAEKMAEASLNIEKANRYFNNVLKIVDENEISKIKENSRDKIVSLFEGEGVGLNENKTKRTIWTAYNAVVEYVDYHKNMRGNDNDRLKKIWFGSGAKIKKRAFEEAKNMVFI